MTSEIMNSDYKVVLEHILKEVNSSEALIEKCQQVVEKVVLYRSTLSLGKEENRVPVIENRLIAVYTVFISQLMLNDEKIQTSYIKYPALIKPTGISFTQFLEVLTTLVERLNLNKGIITNLNHYLNTLQSIESFYVRFEQIWKYLMDNISLSEEPPINTNDLKMNSKIMIWSIFLLQWNIESGNSLEEIFCILLSTIEFVYENSILWKKGEAYKRNDFFKIVGIESKDLPNITIYNNKCNNTSSFIQALMKENVLIGNGSEKDMKSLSNMFVTNLNENTERIINYYNENHLKSIYDIDGLMLLKKDNNNYINIYTPIPNPLTSSSSINNNSRNNSLHKESPYRSLNFDFSNSSTQLITPISPSFSFGHTPTPSDFKSMSLPQQQQQQSNNGNKYNQLQQLQQQGSGINERVEFPNIIETPILGSISLSKLLNILDEIPLSGSKEFNDYLNDAGESENINAHRRIETIISLINNEIIKCFKSQNILIEKSRKAYEYGLRLYYHSCSKIFRMERDRVRDVNKFLSLVKNDNFHRSLITICMEVIFHHYNLQELMFPRILEYLSIDASDFIKLMDTFNNSEPSLPRTTIQHIVEIEEKCLQIEIWKENTTVYKNIKTVLCYKRNPLSCDPLPSHIITSIDLLIRKIITYAHRRLNSIYQYLKIKRNIFAEIWSTFYHIFQNKIELFRNRHMDTILICCIFAVGKKLDRDNTSMDNICNIYRKIHKREGTKLLACIELDNENNNGDIIKFYNSIFLNKEVKEYVLRLNNPKYQMNERTTSEISNEILSPPTNNYNSPTRPVITKPPDQLSSGISQNNNNIRNNQTGLPIHYTGNIKYLSSQCPTYYFDKCNNNKDIELINRAVKHSCKLLEKNVKIQSSDIEQSIPIPEILENTSNIIKSNPSAISSRTTTTTTTNSIPSPPPLYTNTTTTTTSIKKGKENNNEEDEDYDDDSNSSSDTEAVCSDSDRDTTIINDDNEEENDEEEENEQEDKEHVNKKRKTK